MAWSPNVRQRAARTYRLQGDVFAEPRPSQAQRGRARHSGQDMFFARADCFPSLHEFMKVEAAAVEQTCSGPKLKGWNRLVCQGVLVQPSSISPVAASGLLADS